MLPAMSCPAGRRVSSATHSLGLPSGLIEADLADDSGWKYGVRSLYMKPGKTNAAPDD
jgi:hypothetical protein